MTPPSPAGLRVVDHIHIPDPIERMGIKKADIASIAFFSGVRARKVRLIVNMGLLALEERRRDGKRTCFGCGKKIEHLAKHVSRCEEVFE